MTGAISTIVTVIGLILQLGAMVFFAGRFANRLDGLERRMTDTETDVKRWQEESAQLAAIRAQIVLLTDEMRRVRDRLDAFLDGDRVGPRRST